MSDNCAIAEAGRSIHAANAADNRLWFANGSEVGTGQTSDIVSPEVLADIQAHIATAVNADPDGHEGMSLAELVEAHEITWGFDMLAGGRYLGYSGIYYPGNTHGRHVVTLGWVDVEPGDPWLWNHAAE